MAVGRAVVEAHVPDLAQSQVLEVRARIEREGAVPVIERRALRGRARHRVEERRRVVVAVDVIGVIRRHHRRPVLARRPRHVLRHRVVVHPLDRDGESRTVAEGAIGGRVEEVVRHNFPVGQPLHEAVVERVGVAAVRGEREAAVNAAKAAGRGDDQRIAVGIAVVRQHVAARARVGVLNHRIE